MSVDSQAQSPTPFATDDELAARIRAVELELRKLQRTDLAVKLAEVAHILDPEGRALADPPQLTERLL